MTMTDLDFTVLEDLDFDVPCEAKYLRGQDCPGVAEWTVVYRNHCIPSNGDSIICAAHRDYLMADGPVLCATCNTAAPFLQFLIRIERIRP